MLSLMIGRQYDEVRELGQKLIDDDKADFEIYMLLGDTNFYDRKLDEALKYYEKAEEGLSYSEAKKDTAIMELNFRYLYYNMELIDKIKNGYANTGEIRGKVTINGKPAPYVYVYLKRDTRSAAL